MIFLKEETFPDFPSMILELSFFDCGVPLYINFFNFLSLEYDVLAMCYFTDLSLTRGSEN